MTINEKIFPTLYDLDSFDNVKTWDIKVTNFGDYSEIITVYGRENKVENRVRIDQGKNVGKSNMTTHFTQGISDAQSKWTKKISQGYYEQKNDQGNDPKLETKNPFPMLAQDYHKMKHKIVFPCFVQPKLDGYRCIFNTTTKNITSRTGKATFEIIKSSSIYNELLNLPPNLILDGELYASVTIGCILVNILI